MSLEINVAKGKESSFTVSLTGSLDSETYMELKKSLEPVLVPSTKNLILNMSGVDYISSSGVGVILETKKMVEKNGGAFLMTNLRPQIKKVFDIMKAIPNMNIFASVEEADAYLSEMQRREREKQA
ncbi:MAG: STAS domain-containing protein [Candidatus Omnitrophica bacterium]|nr:STAS domain-containing protein [Candidatus Omnitrophota bacterium]